MILLHLTTIFTLSFSFVIFYVEGDDNSDSADVTECSSSHATTEEKVESKKEKRREQQL